MTKLQQHRDITEERLNAIVKASKYVIIARNMCAYSPSLERAIENLWLAKIEIEVCAKRYEEVIREQS